MTIQSVSKSGVQSQGAWLPYKVIGPRDYLY